ncbi:MAG: InlB B-repeat-containing protein [Lachnospiraceae bacterium]|nr:InlB B-repeat-containing protein [Lachnospiraceae bacterium]
MRYRKLIYRTIKAAAALCMITSCVALASPADTYGTDDKAIGYSGEAADQLTVEEVESAPVEDRVISAEEKGTEEEAIQSLPDTWSVTLEDGTETEASVTWECMDDFNNDEYTSYVFQGRIEDDEISSNVSENEEDKLIMEICFDSEIKKEHAPDDCEIPVYEVVLSPNSIIPDLEEEQETGEVSGDFTEDYGEAADAVIEVTQENKLENSKLSYKATELFQSISPTKDNYLYNQLTDDEQAFYNEIDKWVTNYLYYGGSMTDTAASGITYRTTAYIEAGDLTTEQVKDVRWYYTANNPQAFFLSNLIIVSGKEGSRKIAIAAYPDADTPAEIKAKAEEIAGNILDLSDEISGSTEYAKSKKAYELLCGYVDYDHDAVNNQDAESKKQENWGPGNISYDQSIISVFSGSRRLTVCAGYSKSYTALLRTVGMDSFSVTSASHEWNKVDVCGDWYATDTTWADQGSSNLSYNYLLKSDATLLSYDSSGKESHVLQSRWEGKSPLSGSDYSEATSFGRYRIDYRLNGGRNNAANPSNYTVNTESIVLKDPVRSGYVFGGWYEDEACTNEPISEIKGTDKKNYVLYAKWSGCVHEWDDGKVTTKAACLPGVRTFTCKKCGEEKTEEIEATGSHSWSEWETTTYPSCESAGIKARECTVCGKVERSTVKATGHKWSTKVTRKATCAKNGVITRTCKNCGDIETQTIYYPKTFKLAAASYVYSGKAIKPAVTVKGSDGKTIAAGNYTVAYSGNKNVGEAVVAITFKGNYYSGTRKLSFIIKPKATTLNGLSARSKGFTVKWKKQATQVSGYQIQYSTNSKFTSNNKTVTISKPGTVTRTVSNLMGKKRYYVRIRTYRKVNGTTYYSAWSGSKAVVTKK